MPDIPKHNSKKERESNNVEQSWVNFSISWDTVGIYNFLEGPCEIVGLDMSGRSNFPLRRVAEAS